MKPPDVIYGSQIRKVVIEQSYRAHVGHIGSALSIADIIAALYSGILRTDPQRTPDRDRLILSKGHAALALYAALFLKGWIAKEVLDTYCGDDTLLGVHPEHHLPGVDFSTGSLGHGLSLGAGAALAAKLQQSERRVFVLVSDAECNSGATWEAVMFAAHHRLSNLVAIIDLDGQQAFGYTKDILDLSAMKERWDAFGWYTREVDGHDVAQITAAIRDLDTAPDRPRVLVARTVFGKGVSYMESRIKWHYWFMSPEESQTALREIEAAP